MNGYKRILCLIVCFCFCFCGLAINAFAADLAPNIYTDFISQNTGGAFIVETGGYQAYKDAPSTYVDSNSLTFVSFTFDAATNYVVDHYVIDILSDTVPNTVELFANDVTYTCYSTGYVELGTTNLYSYVCWPDVAINSSNRIMLRFNNGADCEVSIASARGYFTGNIDVKNVDIRMQADMFYVSTSQMWTDTIRNESNVALPYYTSYTHNPTPSNPATFEVARDFITIPANTIPLEYIDKLYFRVRTIYTPYNANVVLLSSDGTEVIAALDTERISSQSVDVFSSNNQIGYTDTVFVVDMSGYQIEGKAIRLSFVDDTATNGEHSTDGLINHAAVLSVQKIVATPIVSDIPWYISMVRNIKGFFTNLGSIVSDGFSSVGTWFADMKNSVVSGFNSVVELLDMLVNGDQGAADKFDQQGQQAEDSLNNAGDVLSSVSKPDITPDNLFNQYLNFDTGGLAVLSMITSNSYVTDMLVLVFTFALAGFIFYGKKG